MKYILGIDTTFHTSSVGLVDENGKVLINKRKDIDFTDENAKKFFNFHNKSTLSLLQPILNKYLDDIVLVSASSEEGLFHSVSVGAIIANSISCFFGKNIVGINHEIGHLHSNWLNRNPSDFLFPIISLNISGAHSNIYLIKDYWNIQKVSEIIWQTDSEKFGGLGALFDLICYQLNIAITKGGGGSYLEKIAQSGKPKYKKNLKYLIAKKKNGNFHFDEVETNISKTLNKLKYYSLVGKSLEEFQKDFSLSILDVLFESLASVMLQVAKETMSKEIHLVGGVALNKILSTKLNNHCQNCHLDFKKPLKPEFCGDNGAMAAISGFYKWKYSNLANSDFLTIEPSNWYYSYYAKYFAEKSK